MNTGSLAALLDDAVVSTRPLRGGDLSQVARATLASGRSVVAKSGGDAVAEAEMLRAIAETGAPAPAVLAADGDLLVLEDLGEDTGLAQAWGDLGACLRRLHDARGESYGWHRDHAFGPVAIVNAPAPTWPAFWAERRLTEGLSDVPADLARRVERLAARVDDILPRDPAPALLHGDLWTGNVMARSARVTGLIDPACYHGHAEVDLAMLALFGSPDAAFDESYGPPEPGRDARRPVYQLWPAMVHLRLFGGGYRGLVERCLSAAP